MWSRLRALIIKELLSVWRDRKSRFVLIVPPLIQLFVFSYAATYDVTNIRIAVLNEDAGAPSRDLIARFEAAPDFARVLHLDDASAIARVIDNRDAVMVVHLGVDFSRRLLAGVPTQAQLVLDGRGSNTAQIVMGYASTIIGDFNRDWAALHKLTGPSAPLIERAWFNPNLLSLWVVVPGLMGILTQVVALVVTALSVARERELGTFDQLLVTPLRPAEILIGKIVPALIIGMAEGTLIVVAALLWFRIPLVGSLALLYLSLFVFLLSIIGVGLFISALSGTQQQAILGAFLFLVPAIILSGFATPIENMPEAIRMLTLGNPLRHFLVIVQGIFLKDLPAELVLASVWPMAVIGTVTLGGAVWLFRNRLR
ncbi:antibiotic ABC transporter permease [Skermanella stibiiresistens SB22]|uniref:Antibiotic ABC transporter permease n=1 Tax=Skermanella stibiiresistens SB22 TaxID=1385369 RepID=W9GYH0_9PROT|nr:ABC transporter permease [Skermanella stibiiresistens]EWY38869.1 antibiotic ABC transporter permease [Skermanella stibiiresistens SB22]